MATHYNVWTVDNSHDCTSEQPPCMHRRGVVLDLRRLSAVRGACGNPRCDIAMWGCVLSGQYHICKPRIRPCRLTVRSEGVSYASDRSQVGRSGLDSLVSYTCPFSNQILDEERAADNWYDDATDDTYWNRVAYSVHRGEFDDEPYHYDLYTGDGATEYAAGMQQRIVRHQKQKNLSRRIDAYHIADTKGVYHHQQPPQYYRQRHTHRRGASSVPRRGRMNMDHATPEQRTAAAMERSNNRTRQREQRMGSALDSNTVDTNDALPTPSVAHAVISLSDIEQSAKRVGNPRNALAVRNSKKRPRPEDDAREPEDDTRDALVVPAAAVSAAAASRQRRHVWCAYTERPVPVAASGDITEWSSTWPDDIIPEESVRVGIVDQASIARAFTTHSELVVTPPPPPQDRLDYDVYRHLVAWQTINPLAQDAYNSFSRVSSATDENKMSSRAPGNLTFYDATWCAGASAAQRQCCKSRLAGSVHLVCCDYYWQEYMFPDLERAMQPHLDRLAEILPFPVPYEMMPPSRPVDPPRSSWPSARDISELLLLSDMKSGIACDHHPRSLLEHGPGIALSGHEAVALRIVACLMESGLYQSSIFHDIVRASIGSAIPAIHADASAARAKSLARTRYGSNGEEMHLLEYAPELPPAVLDSLVLGLRARAGDPDPNLGPYQQFTAAVIALLSDNLHPSALYDMLTPPEVT